ncbi:zinc finger protein 160 [Spodoptera frugiperda]|uniref:Zinc finger protein 160 n=1 Tax=Spodoptera frugiperda TaxID=7108 RepID=A0A9R0F190_SPOFR|nr:zinc finger protein 160 [Spodoptera frugiperda]
MLTCRICLTTKESDNITDSSCYSRLFIQILALKNFNETLFLCMWCKATLRRTMALLNLASKSQEILQTQIAPNYPVKQKSIHTLNTIQNFCIDIPPKEGMTKKQKETDIEEYEIAIYSSKDTKQAKINNDTQFEFHEITDNYTKDSIFENDLTLTATKIEVTDNSKDSIFENDLTLTVAQNKNKKQDVDYKEYNFETIFLDINEQLKEVELKKAKCKDFEFACEECGLGFLTKDVLDDHKVRHTKLSGPYKCVLCALHFKSQDVLTQHRLSHRRRFKCLRCSYMCKRWAQCLSHRTKCGGIVEPTICRECSKIFNNEHSLKIHMKLHKTERKYCCAECGKKFMSKHHLKVHIRSHSGIKPFSCLQCSRSFSTRSNLRAHSAVHTQDPLHYCVECHIYYKSEKSLKRHFKVSAKHATVGNKLYPCKECTKEFSTEKLLNSHINSRHDTEYKCPQCDKTFSNNSNLKKHIKCIHITK